MAENLNTVSEIKKVTSPTPTPDPKEKFPNSIIGNVEIGNKCARILIENENLKVGDKVQIVFPEDSQQKISEAEIIRFSECKEEFFGDLVHDNRDISPTQYSLKLSDKNDKNGGFGIGVVGTNSRVKIEKNLTIIDLNNDGKDEYFRECTSNEGLHLTVWTGKPLLGTRIWHSYYHFNYDTEPNCTDKDY